ncbi:MAG: hypothetical protein LBM19_00130 [Holosporales bacterium]|jgi:hypothetical protein|nr:hypothetical protein [Holosporales bacterium]
MKFLRYFLYAGVCLGCINNGIAAFTGSDPEVAKLQEEVDKLKAEIEALKTEDQSIKGQISPIDELSEKVKALEEKTALPQSEEAPADETAAPATTTGTSSQEVEELKAAVERLKLENAQTDARIERVESQNRSANASSAMDLIGKGLGVAASVGDIVKQVASGRSVAATTPNLTASEREELAAIESDIKMGKSGTEVQTRLDAFNEKVARKEAEANKFQQVTFYGINEAFKDKIVILYILDQARSGKKVNASDILEGNVNTIDQELIDAIYDMAQLGAKMPDIDKNIKLIFSGTPMKVVKAQTATPSPTLIPVPTLAPPLEPVPVSAPVPATAVAIQPQAVPPQSIPPSVNPVAQPQIVPIPTGSATPTAEQQPAVPTVHETAPGNVGIPPQTAQVEPQPGAASVSNVATDAPQVQAQATAINPGIPPVQTQPVPGQSTPEQQAVPTAAIPAQGQGVPAVQANGVAEVKAENVSQTSPGVTNGGVPVVPTSGTAAVTVNAPAQGSVVPAVNGTEGVTSPNGGNGLAPALGQSANAVTVPTVGGTSPASTNDPITTAAVTTQNAMSPQQGVAAGTSAPSSGGSERPG